MYSPATRSVKQTNFVSLQVSLLYNTYWLIGIHPDTATAMFRITLNTQIWRLKSM
jgi:hypothetical protein